MAWYSKWNHFSRTPGFPKDALMYLFICLANIDEALISSYAWHWEDELMPGCFIFSC